MQLFNNGRRPGGFSLVELLAVISIAVVLIGFVVPTVSSLLVSRGMTRAVSDIAYLLERARNQAMTSQSFVWLAFESVVNSEGDEELRAALLSPLDGTVRTVSQAGKLQVSTFSYDSEIFHWPNLKLVPLSSIPRAEELAVVGGTSESLASQKKQTFRFGRLAHEVKAYQVITFTPQGYAMFAVNPKITASYIKAIDLGILESRNGVERRDRPGAGLVLNGFNGQVQVLRP